MIKILKIKITEADKLLQIINIKTKPQNLSSIYMANVTGFKQ